MVVNYDLEIYTKINLFQPKLLLVREFYHKNLKTNQENYPVSQSLGRVCLQVTYVESTFLTHIVLVELEAIKIRWT